MTQSIELIEAVTAGDLAKVKALLAAEPALIHAKTEKQVSLVLLAAYQRNARLVEIILTGAPYELDLPEAAALGALERVQDLLQAQPEQLNTPSPDGFSPLGLACFFGHPAVVKLLVEKGADVNQASANDWRAQPLHSAVAGRNQEIVAYLLQNGADVNARQHYNFTPLHAAAQNGDADLIKVLLEHHANINATTASGETAMDIALKFNHTEAAHMFVAG